MQSLFSDTVETETSTVEVDKAVMAGRAAEAMRPRERRLDAEIKRRVACIAKEQKIDQVEIYERRSCWTEILHPKKILMKMRRSCKDFLCSCPRHLETGPLHVVWLACTSSSESFAGTMDEFAGGSPMRLHQDAKTAFVSFPGKAETGAKLSYRQNKTK